MSQKPPRPRPNVMNEMLTQGLTEEIARVRAEEKRRLNNLFSLEDQKPETTITDAMIWLKNEYGFVD